MNYLLAILLLALACLGYIQFKRGKEQVTEAERQKPEKDRHSADKMVKAMRMQNFWSHQCTKVYKELHK